MELATIYIFLAGLLGLFAGAVKIKENEELKKENLILKRKLGKIDDLSEGDISRKIMRFNSGKFFFTKEQKL